MNEPLTIRRYAPEDEEAWNIFVAASANGTFLHDRRFMGYHADRFEDHSLIMEVNGRIMALLPANRVGRTLQSHGGLTYGGLITGSAMSAEMMVKTVSSLRDTLRNSGFDRLLYKAIPHIFHRFPAEADIYALHQAGARLVRCDLASAIAIGRSPKFSKSKRQGASRARKAGLEVKKSNNFSAFWRILTERLSDAHGAAPTHSLQEIELLRAHFPERIRLYLACAGDLLQGGLLVFDCGQVAHVQYMATTDAGRREGALDLIVSHLLDEIYSDRTWFNFGISTTNGGRTLNTGLARQKEMFGARSVLFEQYEWDLG
ncbi:GNAT family N-acetyltransferase [Pelagivirga sediminicola]|uniref:GNAT family N-acetyltransferase n=1 Tax=Pelagivirga sediminicola TaxID=2170575 RepID=A0A2T7GAT1_9RHOB|nr:GNAT family N-acetyltransferase [Pelagivirga sediminicola]PVA11534.1 GNAT family N-acetyltransferase [Pelagivirga sediminicola]